MTNTTTTISREDFVEYMTKVNEKKLVEIYEKQGWKKTDEFIKNMKVHYYGVYDFSEDAELEKAQKFYEKGIHDAEYRAYADEGDLSKEAVDAIISIMPREKLRINVEKITTKEFKNRIKFGRDIIDDWLFENDYGTYELDFGAILDILYKYDERQEEGRDMDDLINICNGTIPEDKYDETIKNKTKIIAKELRYTRDEYHRGRAEYHQSKIIKK